MTEIYEIEARYGVIVHGENILNGKTSIALDCDIFEAKEFLQSLTETLDAKLVLNVRTVDENAVVRNVVFNILPLDDGLPF